MFQFPRNGNSNFQVSSIMEIRKNIWILISFSFLASSIRVFEISLREMSKNPSIPLFPFPLANLHLPISSPDFNFNRVQVPGPPRDSCRQPCLPISIDRLLGHLSPRGGEKVRLPLSVRCFVEPRFEFASPRIFCN